MNLNDFIGQQPAFSQGPNANAEAIGVRMQNALYQSQGSLTIDDLPGIKAEADKLTPPQRAALKAAFILFADFHRDEIANGVVP